MVPWDNITPGDDGLVVVRPPIRDTRPGYCGCGCGSKARWRFVSGHGSYRQAKLAWRVRESGCWEWALGVNSGGYGRATVGGRRVLAHRAIYEIVKGPLLPLVQIDHLCRNTGCVNPDHLEAVTPAENSRRKVGGLSWADVAQIRGRAAYIPLASLAELAAEYGVRPKTIIKVVLGETWTETENERMAHSG